MRTTAILNLKGGVGKTVTAINMASILATVHGQRVLLIDADSQCNATEFFGGDEAPTQTLADLLQGEPHLISMGTEVPDLSILPASDALMDLDLTKAETKQADIYRLRDALRACTEFFDAVLIDCPPSFSAASAAALIAADDVIIPIKLDAFSLRGMANLMRQVENMRRINPDLRIAGVLPTMYYTSGHMISARAMLLDSGLPLLPSIRRSPKVDDMTFAQRPLCIYAPKSAAGIDYRAAVEAYIGGDNCGR